MVDYPTLKYSLVTTNRFALLYECQPLRMQLQGRQQAMLGSHIIQVGRSGLASALKGAVAMPAANLSLFVRSSRACVIWLPAGAGWIPTVRCMCHDGAVSVLDFCRCAGSACRHADQIHAHVCCLASSSGGLESKIMK
jgi:hypothetical protein